MQWRGRTVGIKKLLYFDAMGSAALDCKGGVGGGGGEGSLTKPEHKL